jgi:sentrin-specific protease 7
VNRLGNSHSNPNPDCKSQRPITSTHQKAFDLHRDEAFAKPTAHNRHKKQKISTAPVESNGSSAHVVDLDDEPGDGWRHGVLPTNRSGQSQSQTVRHRNGSFGNGGVEEFQRVEEMVNPRRRQISHSTGGQMSKGGGSNRFLAMDAEGKKRSAVRLDESVDGDDPNDPISDSDAEFPQNQPDKKGSVQVLISGPHKGSAFRVPPQRKANGTLNLDVTRSSTQTGTMSEYFAPAQDRQRKLNSAGSHYANEPRPNRNLARLTRQQDLKSKKESARSTSNGSYEDSMSLDEISTDHHRKDFAGKLIAGRLVEEREKSNRSSTLTNGRDLRNRPSGDDSTSEEDVLAKKADIKHTDFGNSKKLKRKKIPGEDWYDVVQVFSKADRWLVEGSKSAWSLCQNCEAGVLTIFDEKNSAVPDLVLVPRSVNKIMQGLDNSKIIIFKAVDQTAQRANMICLEFKDSDQSKLFTDKMKLYMPNIGVFHKERSVCSCFGCATANYSLCSTHLDKIFMTSQKQPESTMKRRQSMEEDADDIVLAKRNSEARHADRWAKAKANKPNGGRRVIDRLENGETGSHLETKGDTRIMRTRSSPDLFEFDDEGPARPFRRPPELGAETFYSKPAHSQAASYGTRSSARLTDRESLPRQPPKLRSPSPDRWTQINPNWAKDWKASIIYPREGKDKATVDRQDIERLDEGEFLNDNLIIFYLRWLERRLGQDKPDLANRIYFHNTFFYERLTKVARGKKGINYEAVERWTAKVDLLSYDYIIVPVNEHTHWYVAIICNAPKLLIPEPNPEPMIIEDSQSEGKEEDIEDDRINVDTTAKSSQSSPSSPKPILTARSEPEVNTEMEETSLDENPSEERPSDELPNDAPPRMDGSEASAKETSESVGNDGADPRGMEAMVEAATAKVDSDLAQPPVKKSTLAKKGKRKSVAPAPRRYDPTEPRIITLDSLGLKHSPTCTNLKEYLIAEIKSKRNIDIPTPGPLGMTATQIPLQDNHCDCGLFLLSYIEKFLDQPDEFISSILQSQVVDLEIQWPKASDMRVKIRNLLLDLQKEQVVENERLQREKGKGKKASKVDSKAGSNSDIKYVPTIYPEPKYREASKSSRNSPGPARPKTESEQLIPDQLENAEQPKRKGRPSRDGYEIPEDVDIKPATQKDCSSKLNSFLSSFGSRLSKTFGGQGRDENQSIQTRPGRSKSNAVEIMDSPEKPVLETRLRSVESPSRFNRAHLRSPSPEQEEPPHSSLRDRRPTPFPKDVPRSPGQPDLEGPWEGMSQSPPLEDVDDSVQLVESEGIGESNDEITHVEKEDMLLKDPDSQDEVEEVPPPPPLLTSSEPSSQEIEHHENGRIQADLPSLRKHQSIIEVRDDEEPRHRMVDTDGLDPLDKAVIGRHIRF